MEKKFTARVFGSTIRTTLTYTGTAVKVTMSECTKTRKPRVLFTAMGTAQDTLADLKCAAAEVERMNLALQHGPRTAIHADLALAASALSVVRRTQTRKAKKS